VISALLAAGGSLDFGAIFLDLALILIIAKAAAEVSERVGIPAVIGEIVAGIMIGPSLLGLVEPSDAIRVLAEVGVIILLAEVGLEMDLDELRKVGRASVLVAIIGVAVPMSSGYFAGSILGESVNASLFLGAALAATSVGITARVFGDLKALSSTEARIVLGAAVADDVMGLVILTIVTRIVEQGSVDMGGLVSTVGLAFGFLLVAGALGIVFVPRLLSAIGARALSPVTIGVIAAGITFGFSAAASAANLAPIIGAFVAGAALGRSTYHDRIARDFQSIGAIFIPVFFMLIGMDTDVTKFFDLRVLGIAVVLSAIAVGGKMISALGAQGAKADKLLIGMGMVPRGEVGLIFAAIGVSVGVFNDDLYAVVLLVVLVTTVAAPPLLRWRITQLAQNISVNPVSSTSMTQQVDEALAVFGRLSAEDHVVSLLRQGESKTVEFKQTFSLDIADNQKKSFLEDMVIKTIAAFLNSDGGDLLIGVDDDSRITGLDYEIEKLHKGSRDEFLKHFKNRFKTRIGEQFYPRVAYVIVDVGEMSVLRIQCEPSDFEVFVDGKDFYVRTNPATDKLDGPKLLDYVKQRFHQRSIATLGFPGVYRSKF
jgi:Kef-type K+ transport system membrane component KefB